MFTKILKSISPKPFSGVRQVLKTTPVPFRSFCTEPSKPNSDPEKEYLASLKEGSVNLTHLRNHLLSLEIPFCTSIFAIAYLSYYIPFLFPPPGSSSFLLTLLAGFIVQPASLWKLEKTKPTTAVETTPTGGTQTTTYNPLQRKFFYATSVIGQAWFLGILSKAEMILPQFLPVAFVGSLFSNLGHAIYLKFLLKSGFSLKSLFACGTLAGFLGMGLIGSGLLAPCGIVFPPETWVFLSSGVITYNYSVMRRFEWVLEPLAYGDKDSLKHASWLSGSWGAFFVPTFIAFVIFKIQKENSKEKEPF